MTKKTDIEAATNLIDSCIEVFIKTLLNNGESLKDIIRRIETIVEINVMALDREYKKEIDL